MSEFDVDTCVELVSPTLERRPANALNIEIGQPLLRCRLQTPEHWNGFDERATRWLLSGGSPLVLGVCHAGACPKRNRSAREDLK